MPGDVQLRALTKRYDETTAWPQYAAKTDKAAA